MDIRRLPTVKLPSGASITGVPGAHYRLATAQAAIVALDRLRPAAVTVELHASALAGVRSALSDCYPAPCGVCWTNPVVDRAGHVVIVSPSDSIAQASRWATETSTPLFGVDLLTHREPDDARDSRTVPEPADDWIWYGPATPEQLRPWRATHHNLRKTPADLRREEFMAVQLRRLAEKYGRIVWVGGAAHWARIADLLLTVTDKLCPEAPFSPELAFELAYLDPAMALARYLDDLPNATYQFHCATREAGDLSRFDKWRAFEGGILPSALSHYTQAFAGMSPRAVRSFNALLRRLVGADGLVAPRLSHLYAAGAAAVDEHFARLVVEKALEFPVPNLTDVAPGQGGRPLLTQAAPDDGRLYRSNQGDGTGYQPVFPPPTAVDSSGRQPQETTSEIRRQVRRTARRASNSASGSRWEASLPEDHFAQRMHQQARRLAREAVRRTETISLPFSRTLSLGEGVDVRATVRGYVRRQPEPFVMNRRRSDASLVEDHEPVVWELKDPGHYSTNTMLYGWHKTADAPVGQSLYFSYFWATQTRVGRDLLRWDWGVSVNFCDPTSQTRARQFATANPGRVPTTDLPAGTHAGNVVEKIGAAAVKHARLAVVWVSPTPAAIPASVRALAQSTRKRLIHVSTARLPPEDLDRLTYYHLWRTDDWDADEMVPPEPVLAKIEQYRRERLKAP